MTNNTIFFSYSRDDSEFVLKLAKDLREAGTQIWLDQLDIAPGNHWDSTIEEALQKSGTLLVVLSKASVESNNVMDEVSFAIEEDKTVIPVLLEECDIPFRLRRIQPADFRVDYQDGMASLAQLLHLPMEIAHKLNLNKTASNVRKASEPVLDPPKKVDVEVREPAMAYSAPNRPKPQSTITQKDHLVPRKSRGWVFPFVLLLLILGAAGLTYFCIIPDYLGLNEKIGNSCESKEGLSAVDLCSDVKSADCFTTVLKAGKSSDSDLLAAREGLTKLLKMEGYIQYAESDGGARYFDQLQGSRSKEPSPGDFLIATEARNVRNGVIGVDEVAERNGDVIDIDQVVLVEEAILSGTALWIKIHYSEN